MNRFKLFVENFFVYGFINVLNKLFPILLLPIITRLLNNTSDFGIFDMYNLIIEFGSPLIILGLFDAMFREYFESDSEQYRINVTTTANRLVLLSSLFVCTLLVLFNKNFSSLFFGSKKFGSIVIFSALTLLMVSNNTIISAPTRIQNQRKVFVISGILNSLIYYTLAILFIRFGLSYFGLIYANLFASATLLLFFWLRNKKFFTFGKFNFGITKELFNIGLPLVPTFLIYWIYHAADKIMILRILGPSELGIYSIGARVSNISLFIYTAFSGGYSYFKFSLMKELDQVRFNSLVFETLGFFAYIGLLITYPFIGSLFICLFPKIFSNGKLVFPYLFLSPLLLMLFQVVSSQFLIIKKSYWITITLSIGAITNVVLNWFFIHLYGIKGAAIATLIGYSISLISVSIIASLHKLHKTSRRFIICSALLILYLFIMESSFMNKISNKIFLSFIIILIYVFFYKDVIEKIFKKIIFYFKNIM